MAESMGKVSGWGWSLGYLGGLLSLGLLSRISLLVQPAWRFRPTRRCRHTMLITAGLFALAIVPTFLLLRERA